MAKIDLKKSWRPWNAGLIHAGIYRIPQDMSADMAAKAVKDGFGEMLPEEKPKVAQRTYRKTPAPENKVLAAPEDKEQSPFPSEED